MSIVKIQLFKLSRLFSQKLAKKDFSNFRDSINSINQIFATHVKFELRNISINQNFTINSSRHVVE